MGNFSRNANDPSIHIIMRNKIFVYAEKLMGISFKQLL